MAPRDFSAWFKTGSCSDPGGTLNVGRPVGDVKNPSISRANTRLSTSRPLPKWKTEQSEEVPAIRDPRRELGLFDRIPIRRGIFESPGGKNAGTRVA
jgi:hypothetical protein